MITIIVVVEFAFTCDRPTTHTKNAHGFCCKRLHILVTITI